MDSKLEYLSRGDVSEEGNLFVIASKEVDTWFLMESPWPVLSIVLLYLFFVIKIGPELMKNRKPFNIKSIILIYNLYQTISNAYIVSLLFITKGAINYVWKHKCHPMDPAINPFWPALNYAAWLYFFSKVMDLLDTVFFILRKKQSHITFLHVYHHANMVLSSWIYLKYIKGEQGVIVGVINASVHVVMYGYYFLISFRTRNAEIPVVEEVHHQNAKCANETYNYLRKPSSTVKIALVWMMICVMLVKQIQFIIVIVYMATLLIAKCKLPKALSLFVIVQGVIFFVLFANFYVHTYIMKDKSKTATANGNLHVAGKTAAVANGNSHVSPADKVK